MNQKYYSRDDMRKVLRELKMKPDTSITLTTQQVAAIWTWRAKNEYQSDRVYDSGSVRKRVFSKSLKPINPESWEKLFTVESAFIAPLYPDRANKSAV